MLPREFEKQAAQLLENLAKGRQIARRTKILLEDLNSLTILSIENRAQSPKRKKQKSLSC
jgi:hypothetical protein